MQPRTLDRVPFFDERSRNYGVRSLPSFATTLDRTHRRVWTPGPLLDQGREGACTGFGGSGELGATPKPWRVDNTFAQALYQEARRVDQSEGRYYSDGATVLAMCKAAQKLNLITTYRWCFSIDDVIDALLRHSPVVIGINWYEDMYSTDENGLVQVGGSLVGGHCLYVHGWWPQHIGFRDDMFVWQNSWGNDYGMHDKAGIPTGRGFIRKADLTQLLAEDGEAVVFTDKKVVA
jgi:hypothetical protein